MNFIFQAMASIDKLYIDGKEYSLYRQWWIDHYELMKKELGMPIWLYTFSIFWPDAGIIDVTPEFLENNTKDIEYYKNAYDFPIWNTSERVDMWLIKNCSFISFRERMLDVYPSNWKGFKGQKWVPKKKEKPKYIR